MKNEEGLAPLFSFLNRWIFHQSRASLQALPIATAWVPWQAGSYGWCLSIWFTMGSWQSYFFLLLFGSGGSLFTFSYATGGELTMKTWEVVEGFCTSPFSKSASWRARTPFLSTIDMLLRLSNFVENKNSSRYVFKILRILGIHQAPSPHWFRRQLSAFLYWIVYIPLVRWELIQDLGVCII